MSYKVKIDPVARLYMLDSAIWYNEQSPGLGRSYYNSVQQTIINIKTNPFKIPNKVQSSTNGISA